MTFLIVVTSQNSLAQDVIEIKKGTEAPFTGLLFSEKKAREVRVELLELDKTKIILDSKEEQLKLHKTMIKLKDEELELYRQQNERLVKVRNNSDKMQYIWFGLGVIVTGAAVYGAGALSR